jgi:phosphotransferase system HPr (HPr) family protein
MATATVRIAPAEGLHARPAAEFARLAMKPDHRVSVGKVESKLVNGASILEILTLGLKQGDLAFIEVTGPDEENLLAELVALLG